jgi:hypothetical protein
MTSNLSARFAYLDANTLEANVDDFRVKILVSGALEAVVGGITVKGDGIDNTMLVDHEKILYTDAARTITALHSFNTLPQSSVVASSGSDLVNKDYVDAAVEGATNYKDPVRVVGDTQTALTGEKTIDGVALTTGDRVLMTGQTDASENGIYVVDTGAWARSEDANTSAEVTSGMRIWSNEGTNYADTGWLLTTNNPITLGTTDLTFTQTNGLATITAGNGLTKVGNTIQVNASDDSITMNADDLAVNVDDLTIEVAAGVGIRVKAAGVNENHIVSTTFSDVFTGGSGTQVDIDVSTFTSGGSHEVDGDNLDIDWDPANYTPDASPAEASGADSLAAHLKGIDSKFGSLTDRRVETFTLSSGDITNKYVTLAIQPSSPGRVTLSVRGAGGVHYGDDYQMDSGTPTRLTWDSLGLDGLLQVGDKLTATYDV